MANRVMNNKITFYVDDVELAAIKLKMNKMRISNLSLYLRKMALEGRIINVDYSVFNGIAKSIDSISRNVDQIAKRVNAIGNIYPEDIQQIKKAQEEVWQLLREIYSKLL